MELELTMDKNNSWIKEKCHDTWRKVKRVIKEAKEQWMEKQISLLETMQANPVESWKAMRTIEAGLTGHHKIPESMKMKCPDGSFTTSDAEKDKLFVTFFGDDIFGCESPFDIEAIENLKQCNVAEWMASFTFDKLETVIKKAKN